MVLGVSTSKLSTTNFIWWSLPDKSIQETVIPMLEKINIKGEHMYENFEYCYDL